MVLSWGALRGQGHSPVLLMHASASEGHLGLAFLMRPEKPSFILGAGGEDPASCLPRSTHLDCHLSFPPRLSLADMGGTVDPCMSIISRMMV